MKDHELLQIVTGIQAEPSIYDQVLIKFPMKKDCSFNSIVVHF